MTLKYDRIQVDGGGFAQAVSHFAAHGGAGLNVTLPFKVEAWKLCNRLSDRAQVAEAVNTIRFGNSGFGNNSDDNDMFGDNTDGAGLLRDLENNLGITVTGNRILIIGAGGAARGIAGALLECGPSQLVIANRTAHKAAELAERLGGDATGCGLNQLGDAKFDLIINATSAGLGDDAPTINPQCIGEQTFAYDLVYADQPTAFMRQAKQHGAAGVADGLGMLVEQAAESFYLWHEQRPDTAAVINTLRTELAE